MNDLRFYIMRYIFNIFILYYYVSNCILHYAYEINVATQVDEMNLIETLRVNTA